MRLFSLALCSILLATGSFGLVAAQQGQDPSKTIRPEKEVVQSNRRVALIIGNAAYTKQPRLKNTENDARDMAKLLRAIGFQVTLKLNVKKKDFGEIVDTYTRDLRNGGGFGLFFYSGHGAQFEGENYLIPIDCDVKRPADLRYESYALGKLASGLEDAKNNSNVIILDACRNNPFPDGSRGAQTGGLAQVNAPSGTLIAFATGPGRTASDASIAGKNGLYTGELIKHLKTPGLSITDAFIRTRVAVKNASSGQQVPWESTSLESNFSLVPSGTPPVPIPTPSEPDPTPTPVPEPVEPEPKPIVKIIPVNPAKFAFAKTLTGHTDRVVSVSISSDGETVATASLDKTIRLWNAKTGAAIRTINASESAVRSAAFAPDGDSVAGGTEKGEVITWQYPAGTQLSTYPGHTSGVFEVAFSRDGESLAAAGKDRTIRVWDTRSGTLLQTFSDHDGPVRSVAFSEDGTTLVSGGDDKTVRIWSIETGFQAKVLKGHTDAVRVVAFSPDAKLIASGSLDATVKLWDPAADAPKFTLTGHKYSVRAVAFSPDGKTLATGSLDTTIKLWNVETGKLVLTLTGHTDSVNSLAFSPDGTTLVSTSDDKSIRIWQVKK